MPTQLQVENQCFNFGESWTVAFKYDDTNYYRNGPERLKGVGEEMGQSTRAVDVVALHKSTGLLLLEAKDFRDHRIENKKRTKNGEVAVEVAFKVRDTVAALVGASRKSVDEFPSSELVAALKGEKKLTVVLWLEEDRPNDPERSKLQLENLGGLLKEKLAWLKVRTFVLSSRVVNKLPDLEVSEKPPEDGA